MVCVIAAVLLLVIGGAGSIPGFGLLATLVLAAGLVVRVYRRINNPFLTRAVIPGGWLCLLVMLWVAVSAIPLPDALVGSARASENSAARAALGTQAEAPRFYPLSRNRMGSLRILLLLGGAAAAWTLASGLSPARKRQLLCLLVLLGLPIAFAGLYNQHMYVRRSHVWWLWLVPESDPVACFVRREYYVAYLALLTPVAMALAASAASRRRPIALAGWSICFLIFVLAVAASYSRSAAIGAAVGVVLVTVGGTLLMRSQRSVILGVLTLLAVVLVGLMAMRGGLEHRPGPRETEALWSEVGLWTQHALLGAGAEGFRAKSATGQHAPVPVQILVDGGLVGAFLLLAWAAIMSWQLLRGLLHGEGKTVPLAALGALTMAVIHGLQACPIYLPLYGLTLAAILGCLARASGAEKGETIHTLLGERIAIRQILQLRALALALPLILAVVAPFRGDVQRLDDPGHISVAPRADALRAFKHSPGSRKALARVHLVLERK